MSKKRLRQSNWRLSPEALKLLEDTSKRMGLTKTQVVELCIVRQAEDFPELADSAQRAIGVVFSRRKTRSFDQPEFQLAGLAA